MAQTASRGTPLVARVAAPVARQKRCPCAFRPRGVRPVQATAGEKAGAVAGASSSSEVAIFWDLDNVCPGTDPRRAAVVAYRLRQAGQRLGGGALGGVSGEGAEGEGEMGEVRARVGVFRAFGNPVGHSRILPARHTRPYNSR